MKLEHWVFPSRPMKKNERYGYCSVCWTNIGKTTNYSGTDWGMAQGRASYPDSKINPKSGPCSGDTL